MRFAWLRQKSGNSGPVKQSVLEILIFMVYNLVYWVPLVLSITGTIEYRAGFIAFAGVIAVRTVLNWYRVNVLSPEVGQRFPLRAP